MLVRTRAQVVVGRQPAEVFARLTRFDEWPQWGGGRLVSMEEITPGPPRVGGRLRQVTAQRGKETSTELEITELTPNRALRIRYPNLDAHFKLEDAGAGTRLVSSVEVEAGGLLALMYRLLLKRFLAADLRRFKRLVEQS